MQLSILQLSLGAIAIFSAGFFIGGRVAGKLMKMYLKKMGINITDDGQFTEVRFGFLGDENVG